MKLTIIIPAYNMEHYIEKTLASVLAQSRNDFELIIVDDGSTDATFQLVQDTLQNRGGLNYRVLRQQNGGVSAARNAGLEEAVGEYVMFLDGDDTIGSELVSLIYRNSTAEAPDVLCWGFDTVKEDGSLLEGYFDRYPHGEGMLSGAETLKKIYLDRTMWIWTGSAAYRKVFLEKEGIRYTVGCRNGEDQEFTIKALSSAKKVAVMDQILSYYFYREGSVTNSFSVRKFDAVDAFRRAGFDLNQKEDIEINELGNLITIPLQVENYLNNLDSCLVYVPMKVLLKEIEDQYPGLNDEVRSAMKVYRERDLPYDAKCRLFLLSPGLYGGLFWLKHGRNR